MKARVLKSTGSWYEVLTDSNQKLNCRIKGKIRLNGIKHTNPIAVGDNVTIESDKKTNSHNISSIDQRKNYIIRKSSNLSKQTHIIASNVDYVIIICTLAFPPTSTGFIDRILVTAEAYHIPAIIVFNKVDLYDAAANEVLNDLIHIYEQKAGYRCLKTSASNNIGLAELKEVLTQHTSLIMGHSGVGKSTLINKIEPSLNLKTGELSNFHLKGKHTTTFAEMHNLSFGGYIIDTPGIREFGLVDIPDAELSHYFKEMRPFIQQCKFNNCKHINEPECAVKKAVSSGEIDESRYQNYLSILLKEDLYA